MLGSPELHRRRILRYVASSAAVLCVASSVACAAPGANALTIPPAGSSFAVSKLGADISRALAYEHGEGVPKDAKIAAALYCEAAVAGSAEAAFRLGWMYANGRGVAHDDDVASALFGLAAQSGHAYARSMVDRLGGVHGMLPDCMVPPMPPPQTQVADDDPAVVDRLAQLLQGRDDVVRLVDDLAPQFGIDPRLALAVIAVESNFNPVARSVKDAQGLMQLIPETAARFNVRHPFDPKQNVRGGLAYLRWLLAYYRGQVALVAAAYNAGEGVVDRYRGVPPYPETRDYVRRILALFRQAFHPFDPGVAEPSIIARFSGRR
jgi:hypothetical protein